ncbi:MAG: hypothetical protein EOP59_13655 [Sphingomonadales bacterium]|nr:MAG: hypothetical protein EOP59_13655 [Sphingomonadales bacterium]
MTTWLKLKQPTTVWNGPGVEPCRHKYTHNIGSSQTVSEMIANHIGKGTIHLVINCHGDPGPKLRIGPGITPDDAERFTPIAGLSALKMIWMANCNLTYFPGGQDFCFNLARITQCYVVANYVAVANIRPPINCLEDTGYAMRSIYDPFGDMVKPDPFYDELGPWAGFAKV